MDWKTPDDFSKEQHLRLLSEMGAFDEQNALLNQQLAMANALRGEGQRHSTAGGAILGGLGDIVRNLHGMKMGNEAMGKKQGLVDALKSGLFTDAALNPLLGGLGQFGPAFGTSGVAEGPGADLATTAMLRAKALRGG